MSEAVIYEDGALQVQVAVSWWCLWFGDLVNDNYAICDIAGRIVEYGMSQSPVIMIQTGETHCISSNDDDISFNTDDEEDPTY